MRLDAVREAIGAAEAGPFVSVYLDDTHDTEDARRVRELRWRSARSELDRQGAGADQLDMVERAVLNGAPPVGRGGRAVICAGDRVVVDELLPEPPVSVARYSPLPYLIPLFQLMERPIQHVAVATDRIEADVRAVDRFTELHGRDRNVVAGLPGVAAALREGRVEALLVADTITGEPTVLIGPDVTQVATTHADLPDVDRQLTERHADEALPVAAMATGADAVVVEPTPLLTDGVGAVLRYGAPDEPLEMPEGVE